MVSVETTCPWKMSEERRVRSSISRYFMIVARAGKTNSTVIAQTDRMTGRRRNFITGDTPYRNGSIFRWETKLVRAGDSTVSVFILLDVSPKSQQGFVWRICEKQTFGPRETYFIGSDQSTDPINSWPIGIICLLDSLPGESRYTTCCRAWQQRAYICGGDHRLVDDGFADSRNSGASMGAQ